MTITKYTIDSVEYSAYASVAEADAFLRPDPRWTAWSAIQDEAKELNLILASRLIDEAGTYSGTKMDASQPLEFPRMGLLCNGMAVTETLPMRIVDATALLAGSIVANPSLVSVATQTSTGTTRQPVEIEAGSVSIRYPESTAAIPITPDSNLSVPDPKVDELIRCFFAGSASTGVATSISAGTGAESELTTRSDVRYFIW